MFKKEDAKKIETRTTKKGSSYKVFTFECIQCGSDINLQSHRVHKGTGLCIRCGQKGRPYEHILNELISTCKSGRMDYLYGTWQEVKNINKEGDFINIPSNSWIAYWDIRLSDITAVKSYNPNTRSNVSPAVGAGYIRVDAAPSKTFVGTLEDTARAAIADNFKRLSEMQTQYNMHQHGIQQLIRDSEDHLMFGNKVKEDMLPVPSLRVSRKNIVK